MARMLNVVTGVAKVGIELLLPLSNNFSHPALPHFDICVSVYCGVIPSPTFDFGSTMTNVSRIVSLYCN